VRDMSDTNLNIAECLRTSSDFGVNHIHNVCNGAVTAVPWGSADWALVCFLLAFGIVVVGMLAAISIMMIKDC
jgi:hypothetical protein